MEQIKLHKQGDAAVIIIPASMIENTGWEDGVLLDVVKSNNTLHIRRKEEVAGLVLKPSPELLLSTFKHVKPEKLIRYNSGLNRYINELYMSARRVFFMCLDYYSCNIIESGKPVFIWSDKYASSVGVGRSLAYKQMKDAAAHFSKNNELINRCEYIENEGVLKVELSPELIDYITAVDARKYKTTVIPYQSALKLSGRYSWHLYQLIKSRLSANKYSFCISLDELMTELNARVNMEFKDYKRAVIGRAIDEIEEKTEIKSIKCVNAERQGRKVSKVRFEIEMR